MCWLYRQSTGTNGAKGTLIQQAQEIEYKLSGLSRHFQGTYGSAVFPYGAIILWGRDVLETSWRSSSGVILDTRSVKIGTSGTLAGYFFSDHFTFTLLTNLIVCWFPHSVHYPNVRPDKTPPSLFIPAKSTRGGYGEMTVWKQRFYRW